MSEKLLNEYEASERLGVRVATLRKWRWNGNGPRFIKMNHLVRYDPADLESFIQEAGRNSTSEGAKNHAA